MQWFIVCVLALLGVLFLSHTAVAIECYVCNSNTDEDCTYDSVGFRHLKNCSDIYEGPKSNLCRKIRQWIDFDVNKLKANDRVIRTCGYEATNRECYYRAGFGGRQEVCTCYTDRCNSAPVSTSSAWTAIASIAAILLVRNIL